MHIEFIALLSSSVITVHGSERVAAKTRHLKANNIAIIRSASKS
jgi:hypothetical protein